MVPKVEHEDDIFFILEKAQHLRPDHRQLSLVLSVESAASLLRMPKIIEAIESQNKSTGQSKTPHAAVGALLFASEDYCASTGIIRTKERKELLFPRAHMATIAKAYGLQAIDMVCIDFKDVANLQDESLEGRNLGYDGKQAIHPAQVADIQRAYSPSDKGERGSSTSSFGSFYFADPPRSLEAHVPFPRRAANTLALTSRHSQGR